MILKISIVILGGMMVLSIVMMIGNVLSKNQFGKLWAIAAVASLLLAGLLLVIKPFNTAPITLATPNPTVSTQESPPQTHSAGQIDATSTTDKPTSAVDASNNDSSDLAAIVVIWELLKENKPIPPQYQQMLKQSSQK